MTHTRPHRAAHWLGYLGEALLYAGVLVLLFVLWQLFYTDVQAQRTQQRVLEDIGWIDATGTYPEDSTDVPQVVQLIPPELMFTDDPPVMDHPGHAESFGVFHVPRWGRDYAMPISEGVTRPDVLDKLGIGHYPETVMPGGWGNFSLAAHRTSYGKPFSQVDILQEGDALVVYTDDAWYVYQVTSWEIVEPSAVEVIAPTPGVADSDPSGRFITLTTCHPRYSAAQRWIVHGELLYWAPTGHGYPPQMVEDLS